MPIVSLLNVTIKLQQHKLLQDVSLSVEQNQHWLLVGPSGSGKTVLLNTMAGNTKPTGGQVVYDNLTRKNINLVTSKHHFKDVTNTSVNMYYQQRYNSSDSDQTLTVTQYLLSKQLNPNHSGWTVDKVSALLNLQPLFHKELIKLSNGETKRLRLAAALLTQPKVLLLDDPLSGLDRDTQQKFDQILAAIIATGTTIIMSGSGHEIPAAITHIAILKNGCIVKTVPVNDYKAETDLPADSTNYAGIKDLVSNHQFKEFEWIVKMTDVSVSYGQNIILKQVNWQIKPNERWALFGHNGSGKSTLLSLINGDNPQAYANDIVLFDKKRGSGESIWDIKKNIGFLSPEMYQYFPDDQSGLQVIESGYYDTQGLFRPGNTTKRANALAWMKALKIDAYAHKLLKHMPASVQRLCLLARAIIKTPTLLILDEPCQGLDKQQRIRFNQIIDLLANYTPVTLIYVTHYANELPQCIGHVLELKNGEVISA